MDELLSYLREQRADGQSFAATALSEKVETDLVQRFRGLRDEEYAELMDRCQGMMDELARETKKKKFTFAELEENEDDLQKLESWFARIQSRDLVGGERAKKAAYSLEVCRKALEVFADHVYAQEQVTSKLGIAIVEYRKNQDWKRSLKATAGYAAGWLGSFVVRFGVAVLMVIIFAFRVL